MKSFFVFAMVFCASFNNSGVFAQIQISDLLSIARVIRTSYDKDPNQIDGIIKAYIPKGFILNEFISQTDNNIQKNAYFTLSRVQPIASSEKIIIKSYSNDPTYQSEFSVEFITKDFGTYLTWFSTLSSNSNSYKEASNEHLVITYNYANSKISLGSQNTSRATSEGIISTYNMSSEPFPPVYFLKITSKYGTLASSSTIRNNKIKKIRK